MHSDPLNQKTSILNSHKTFVPHFGQWVLPVLSSVPFLFPHSRQKTDEQDGHTNLRFDACLIVSMKSPDPTNTDSPPSRTYTCSLQKSHFSTLPIDTSLIKQFIYYTTFTGLFFEKKTLTISIIYQIYLEVFYKYGHQSHQYKYDIFLVMLAFYICFKIKV